MSNVPKPQAALRYDGGTLVLSGIEVQQLKAYFPEHIWQWDRRVGAWRSDALSYSEVRQVMDAHPEYGIRDELRSPESIRWPSIDLPALRPAQSEAIEAWRNNRSRGVIVMPTGTGKTEVALAIMSGCACSTLVVAPVRDLMYQWHRRILRGLGYDAGIVGDNLFNLRPVTVTTYDSAYIHMSKLGNRFGLIVFDEVHHLPGNAYREAALLCAAPMRLGLSATPERTDGRHEELDRLIGPVVYRQDIQDVVGDTLAEYSVVRIPVSLSEQEQQRYDEASRQIRAHLLEKRREHPNYTWLDVVSDAGSDPQSRKVMRAFHYKKSIEDRAEEKLRVLEDLFRLHVGERMIVFAGSNAMAMDVSRRFLIPSLLNHSRKNERRLIIEGLTEGRFHALVANQVLDEGVDVPAVKVAVVIGGMGSSRQAKQRLGRILRRSGAARAILYEVVCQETREEERSRKRRRNDAFKRTRAGLF